MGVGRGRPVDYSVSFPLYSAQVANLVIIEEGRLPRCEACSMFVMPLALRGGHPNYVLCKQGTALKQKRDIEEN
jgi:hypothetical protein